MKQRPPAVGPSPGLQARGLSWRKQGFPEQWQVPGPGHGLTGKRHG